MGKFVQRKRQYPSGLAKRIGLTLLLAGTAHSSSAQTAPLPDLEELRRRDPSVQTPSSEEQRRRNQADLQERQRQLQAPNVSLEDKAAAEALEGLSIPSESPCFTIHQFVLDVPSQLSPAVHALGASDLPFDNFRFAQDYLRQYDGACIGKGGLNLIVKRLTNLILQRGYSTTRIGIPEQDLTGGVLKLVLVPGVIREIRFSDPTLYGTWRSAFPTGSGQLLNLRDLEQGLEQMKRVPSQDVDMQIVPGDVPGESDVVIQVKRSKPWKLTGTFDDSGAKGTGKLQAGLNLAVDNPLGLNDLFNVGINTDAQRKAGQRGTNGNNVYYAVPAGYWNFAVSGSTYDYHQEVAQASQTFVSSGKSRNLELKIAQLFQRDQAQKNSWQFRVGKRWNHAYIEDSEIAVQERNTTFAELAWVHTHYIGNAQLDLTVAQKWGVNWLNGQTYARNLSGQEDPSTNNLHYSLQTVDATLSVPFHIASQPLTYIGTFRGQTTRSALYLADQFSIGNRYTVRGFDGELTLAAERGFYLRNELNLPITNSGQSAYVGLDYGQVYGPSVANLLGNKLAGATVGLRGGLFGLTYDVFSSWALYKPQGFNTTMPAVGFNLAYQY
ncbi:hemolysin secretion/activation ShlB/FhaC/HecB family protein [Collimonas arenae]|uniref:Hemolysin secretion/activation ShlB/FhaC/HecB family protein n=1 Tax=Collimonas arenae TaxID=279058 RepID=A0A127QFS3_9BURK|nr:ShlB/FhaC/HecB family hemolysin secretion/activation protein [Collimonas arenae]AMP08900.1 hemolysin secretion/activation ShlB/FhaC/HecB family protein [Collimonas arenae]